MTAWMLLFGVVTIAVVLFVLSRSLCRDPDLIHGDIESSRSQRALAEAVVRHMDTRDLVAIASGRLGADALVAAAAERSRDRSSRSSESDESRGVNHVTRLSFVKLRVGRRGGPQMLKEAGQPVALPTAALSSGGDNSSANLLSAAADAKEEKTRSSGRNSSVSTSSEDKLSVSSPGGSMPPRSRVALSALPPAPSKILPVVSSESISSGASVLTPRAITPRTKRILGGSARGVAGFSRHDEALSGTRGGERGDVAVGRVGAEAVLGGVYSDDSCSVCLDEYAEGEQLLQLTCGHVYHRTCIEVWLKGHCVCPCCRTDLDKLAQLAQVFPDKDRKDLQRGLIRADGNALIAIELLLSPRRSDTTSDSTRRHSGRRRPDSRTDQTVATVAGEPGSHHGNAAIGGGGDGNTVSIVELSAAGEPVSGVSGAYSVDSGTPGGRPSSHIGRVAESLSARLRRSSSGRWYTRSDSRAEGWFGGGGSGNVGNTESRSRSRSRGDRRSRARIHQAGSEEDFVESESSRDAERTRHPRQQQGPRESAAVSSADMAGEVDVDVELGRYAGVLAGEAGAAAGAAAAATAAAVVAEARAERERARRPRRPASYSDVDSFFSPHSSHRTMSMGDGTTAGRERRGSERAARAPRPLSYSGIEAVAAAAAARGVAAEMASARHAARRSTARSTAGFSMQGASTAERDARVSYPSFATQLALLSRGDGSVASPGFAAQLASWRGDDGATAPESAARQASSLREHDYVDATGTTAIGAAAAAAATERPSARPAPAYSVGEAMPTTSEALSSAERGDAGANYTGLHTPLRPATNLTSTSPTVSSPSPRGVGLSFTPRGSRGLQSPGGVASVEDRPPSMLARLESNVSTNRGSKSSSPSPSLSLSLSVG